MAHADHAAPATRPTLEVADILRERGSAYAQTHRLSAQQQRVVDALVNCRTAALGGFKSECDHCGAVTIQYASCRNRHCPKCQTLSQTRWVERQCADLLDIGYWHVVFTLPHELNPVAQGNPALVYRLLFKARPGPCWSSAFAAGFGAELGITMVLRYLRCRIAGDMPDDGCPGRAALAHPRAQGFLFPTAALSKVFRGKYLDFLGAAHRNGELRLKVAGGKLGEGTRERRLARDGGTPWPPAQPSQHRIRIDPVDQIARGRQVPDRLGNERAGQCHPVRAGTAHKTGLADEMVCA